MCYFLICPFFSFGCMGLPSILLLQTFDSSSVSSSPQQTSLGLILDRSLLFQPHINNINTWSTCFHVGNINCLRHSLSDHTISILIHSPVTACIDYWNPFLLGLPYEISLEASTGPETRVITSSLILPHHPPSFCKSPGSRSNSEQNWRSSCIHLRSSITLLLLICQIFSISPPHPVLSAHLPSSTLLYVLPTSAPWAELSAALLANCGTPDICEHWLPPSDEIPTPSSPLRDSVLSNYPVWFHTVYTVLFSAFLGFICC